MQAEKPKKSRRPEPLRLFDGADRIGPDQSKIDRFSSSKIDKKTAPAHDFFLGCDAREIDDLRRIPSVEVAA